MLIVSDAVFGEHLRGVGHPERPDRVVAVVERLRELGLLEQMLAARDASDDEIALVHERDYMVLVEREVAGAEWPRDLSTGDVMIDSRSLVVARRAAGGAIVAMEAANEGREAVFALVRPPGHHAEPACGMGFCLFNNAAIAARAFLAKHGGRVLIVDFDYHHGNGTQALFDHGLSYISTHAFPAYPGSGVEIAVHDGDALVNVPLPVSGVTTEAFVAIWERLLPRVAAVVQPGMVMVSAGFDYVRGDPVGDLGVDVSAATPLASAIAAVSREWCGGRVAYVLEGGYDIDALTQSVARIIEEHDRGTGGGSGAEDDAIPVAARNVLARVDQVLGESARRA